MFAICMAKINLNIKLTSDLENLDIDVVGIKNKNKIIYKENDINVTILIFDNKIEMNRECKDYTINLIFDSENKTISTYSVFGGDKTFQLETYTKSLDISDKKIRIDYELEGNNFEFVLGMEDL